jgi:uncharacterized protein DUF4339
MDATYKILGGDGKEYGPVTLEQMLGWVRDGRVSGGTRVWRSDQSGWATARQLPELQIPGSSPSASPVGGALPADQQQLEAKMKSGASWFYWIAGMSLINSIASLTGAGFGFVVGLGITQIVDTFAQRLGGAAFAVALILNLLIAGVFILFGVFAHKRHLWSFIVGMVLYGLDGLLFAFDRHWLPAGFHAFVLYWLFNGYRAASQLRAS